MNQNPHSESIRSSLEQIMVDILSKAGKPYLTTSQLRKRLPLKLLHQLGLDRQKSGSGQVVKALQGCIGNRIRTFKGQRSLYIGWNRSDEDTILDAVKQHPGVSSKALGRKVPILKRAYIDGLNRLIESGRIRCTFSQTGQPAIWPLESEAATISLKAVFKDAYDRVGKGRGFVRIHRVRDALNWPEDTFDRLLGELMADYVIELHGGDPSALSETEIRKSFVDENGTVYITLSWWGDDHDK